MSGLVQVILETVWLLLPAGVGNIAPVLATRIKSLHFLLWPLDAGIHMYGQPLLGNNKTALGLLAGVVLGSITSVIQYFFQNLPGIQAITLVPFKSVFFAFEFGAFLGFGALLGDTLKSFLKRRLGIAPGKSFPVLDQIDFVIGALFMTLLYTTISIVHVVTALIVFGILSLLTSYIGMKLKIKSSL